MMGIQLPNTETAPFRDQLLQVIESSEFDSMGPVDQLQHLIHIKIRNMCLALDYRNRAMEGASLEEIREIEAWISEQNAKLCSTILGVIQGTELHPLALASGYFDEGGE